MTLLVLVGRSNFPALILSAKIKIGMLRESSFVCTNDRVIRTAIKAYLEVTLRKNSEECSHVKIIEELGITHGAARVDIAVINKLIHGYELKSDLDNLDRLPEQMRIYNTVLDRVTLVVGKSHMYEAIKIIPEWWGITLAKIAGSSEKVTFYTIREARENVDQDAFSIACLLWREEALSLLEEIGEAKGVRSKNRKVIYQRLATVLDKDCLRKKVRDVLCSRTSWRFDLQCMPNGG